MWDTLMWILDRHKQYCLEQRVSFVCRFAVYLGSFCGSHRNYRFRDWILLVEVCPNDMCMAKMSMLAHTDESRLDETALMYLMETCLLTISFFLHLIQWVVAIYIGAFLAFVLIVPLLFILRFVIRCGMWWYNHCCFFFITSEWIVIAESSFQYKICLTERY